MIAVHGRCKLATFGSVLSVLLKSLAMIFQEYCLARAEECEHRAEDGDAHDRAEWLLMAEEWRIAATLPDEDRAN